MASPRSGGAGGGAAGDEAIWRKLREAGFDEDAVRRRDKAALIGYISRLESEVIALDGCAGFWFLGDVAGCSWLPLSSSRLEFFRGELGRIVRSRTWESNGEILPAGRFRGGKISSWRFFLHSFLRFLCSVVSIVSYCARRVALVEKQSCFLIGYW